MINKRAESHRKTNEQPSEDTEELIARLAWDYSRKSRNGKHPSIEPYMRQLPDDASREEFQFLITMDAFIDVALDFKKSMATKD